MEITLKDLDLGEHEVGYQWVAGSTPENDPAPGRWLVRKLPTSWSVIFRTINRVEYIILDYDATAEGERVAKMMAQKLVDVANWRYRE